MSKKTNDRITKEDYENKDFLIRLNYVETSEPDRVAKELQIKDQRIAELEEKYKEHRKFIKFINEKSLSLEVKLGCIRYDLDLEVEAKQKLLQIKEYLEKELSELKENSIVPKFNFGDTIFAVVTYIADPKDKTVIESGIVQKIECDKNQIKYWCDNGRIYWEDEFVKLFATKEEAQQKLKD